MGAATSRVRSYFISTPPMLIIMPAMNNAGRTTILYKLKLGGSEPLTVIPTIGFNVETIEYRNTSMTVWDIGGRGKIRPLRRHYYVNTTGIIFVVDSASHESIDGEYADGNAKEDLATMLAEDDLREVPLLVYANKQDRPNAMSVQEITERLGLHSFRNREWHIQGVSAQQNPEALYEGLDWLIQVHKKRSKMKSTSAASPVSPRAEDELPPPAAHGISLSSI